MARYQRKDHLHQRAKKEGLRSRAAYKLDEVQKQFGILAKGQRVADLGCWPGGWLEGAARYVGPGGRLVGVDLAAVDPPIALPNVTTQVADLEAPETADAAEDAPGEDAPEENAAAEGDPAASDPEADAAAPDSEHPTSGVQP